MVLEDDCMSLLVVPSLLLSALCATQNLMVPTVVFFSTGVVGIIGSCCVTGMKEIEKGNRLRRLRRKEAVRFFTKNETGKWQK